MMQPPDLVFESDEGPEEGEVPAVSGVCLLNLLEHLESLNLLAALGGKGVAGWTLPLPLDDSSSLVPLVPPEDLYEEGLLHQSYSLHLGTHGYPVLLKNKKI